MRVLVVDSDGRPLVNTTINIASEHPDPAYSFKEFNCALSDPHLSHDPEYFLSKLQIVLSYLGSACLSRLVERLNAAFQDSRYHRSTMEEQAIANELSSAMSHINNAYHRIKPYSTPGANALAKVCHDLSDAYHKIRKGENDPLAELTADLAPRNALAAPDIPQPDGLARTFFRQRPKENWIETYLRVFSESGWYSLCELDGTDDKAAQVAAREMIRMRDAAQTFDTASLRTIARTYPGLTYPAPNAPNAPRGNALAELTKRREQNRSLEDLLGLHDLASPLNAEAAPFNPGGRSSLFASIDGLNKGGSDSLTHTLEPSNRHVNPFPPSPPPGIQDPLLQNGFGSLKISRFPHTDPLAPQPTKQVKFAPIGHERAHSTQLHQAPADKNRVQAYASAKPVNPQTETPETWEDEISQDGDSEGSPQHSDQQTSTEDEGVLTPRASSAAGRGPSPLFEVNGPDSPTYKTWAQKAASGADEEVGWEKVEKGRKAAHPVTVKEVILPQSIDHKKPRYVIVSGLRANTTLSEVTAPIDTGPLVSVALEKSLTHNGLDARILFIYGSNAVDFVGNEHYSKTSHEESLYGPGVSVALGGTYNGPQADLKGMTVPLNQAGRSDAGAHFERRRLTFSGNGLAMTEQKLRNMFIKYAQIPAADIEAIIVFNPGNATAILANIFSARKVKTAMLAKRSGEWKHCKIMYSSDPCEKHLGFLDKIAKEKQADRAEVVRRAYQKAGKVTC